jgi:hypothetical protein
MATKLPTNQRVRDLCQQTCPITCAVRGASAPMVESLQTLHSQTGHPVRRNTIKGGDKPDAAGVVFKTWIDKRCGQSQPWVENRAL